MPPIRRVLASWFGTGLVLRRIRGSDAGSGTLGAATALVLALVLHRWGWQVQVIAAVVVAAAAVWSARPFAADHADPGWVVIDEAAGTLVATVGLGGSAALVAWAVFRIADVDKRHFPGVYAAEKLPGGWGVTADDLVAGLYGLVAGWLVQWVIF